VATVELEDSTMSESMKGKKNLRRSHRVLACGSGVVRVVHADSTVGGRTRRRDSSDGSGRATASGGRYFWAGNGSGRATRDFGRATAPDGQRLQVGGGLVAERGDGGEVAARKGVAM
jgi:hypothetical protein